MTLVLELRCEISWRWLRGTSAIYSFASAHLVVCLPIGLDDVGALRGGCARMRWRRAETAAVSSRRTPGGSSMHERGGCRRRRPARTTSGMRIRPQRWRARRTAAPAATVFQRCARTRCSGAQVPRHDRAVGVRGDVIGLQRIGGDHRGDQPRDQQREEHRRRHRQAELLEELPGDAAHEAHRQEHRDDGRRRSRPPPGRSGRRHRAPPGSRSCPCACGARCSRSRRWHRPPARRPPATAPAG